MIKHWSVAGATGRGGASRMDRGEQQHAGRPPLFRYPHLMGGSWGEPWAVGNTIKQEIGSCRCYSRGQCCECTLQLIGSHTEASDIRGAQRVLLNLTHYNS